MPQILKQSVRNAMEEAALRVFADAGYERATMARIAAAADVSTGNIYRYFTNREELFESVVGAPFVHRLRRLLRRRVRALAGTRDADTLEPTALYRLAAEELLDFCIENRLRVVVLLARSAGSRYEPFRDELVQDLIRLAVRHFRTLEPDWRPSTETTFSLRQIYRNFVTAMTEILAGSDEEAVIRRRVAGYTRYHLAGLLSLFESTVTAEPSRRRT